MDEKTEKEIDEIKKDNDKYSNLFFDNQTLYISSAFLGFLLTFSNRIVPFSEAKCIWFLVLAIFLFAFVIILGLYGHYDEIKKNNRYIKYLQEKEKKNNIKVPNIKSISGKINFILMWSILFAIFFIFLYFLINILEINRNK